ncbi:MULTISPECIES: hypothetical protein [Corallococcus]|uniref:hypothetical protein n=1 Tax=Corallococcus TaxID=83461 RepID=UPI00117E5A32|nr:MULTISPECIES: hypothetical protein [Corallococcus]NBD09360.1 hypothetical protein [Corallococcus silvisoli]TSC31321.1 hypothetical protein FOF48_11605 [Corallococcus sp. Z5C101001]
MIICPVCDHVQSEGEECEGCGRRFPDLVNAPPAVVAPMPELELTHHAGGRAEVDAPPLPELDLTRLRSGPDLPAMSVPDLELTRSGDTGAVPVAPMMDLDTGRAQDDGVRTAAPVGAVTCRYCRHVQAEGLMCDGCGMRLPRARVAAPVAAKGRGADAGERIPCPSCHVLTYPGRACLACGTRVEVEA